MGRKDDPTSNNNPASKNRLILPPISQNRRTASSVTSNSANTLNETETTNQYGLPSRQNTMMRSISEIS